MINQQFIESLTEAEKHSIKDEMIPMTYKCGDVEETRYVTMAQLMHLSTRSVMDQIGDKIKQLEAHQ